MNSSPLLVSIRLRLARARASIESLRERRVADPRAPPSMSPCWEVLASSLWVGVTRSATSVA